MGQGMCRGVERDGGARGRLVGREVWERHVGGKGVEGQERGGPPCRVSARGGGRGHRGLDGGGRVSGRVLEGHEGRGAGEGVGVGADLGGKAWKQRDIITDGCGSNKSQLRQSAKTSVFVQAHGCLDDQYNHHPTQCRLTYPRPILDAPNLGQALRCIPIRRSLRLLSSVQQEQMFVDTAKPRRHFPMFTLSLHDYRGSHPDLSSSFMSRTFLHLSDARTMELGKVDMWSDRRKEHNRDVRTAFTLSTVQVKVGLTRKTILYASSSES